MLRFEEKLNRLPFGKKEIMKGNPIFYEVFNSKDEIIGTIFYTRVGKFMHWAFFPDECNGTDLFYTNGCLKEISKFITFLYSNNKDV